MNLLPAKRVHVAMFLCLVMAATAAFIVVTRWKQQRVVSAFVWKPNDLVHMITPQFKATSTTVAASSALPSPHARDGALPKGRLRMVRDPVVTPNERSIKIPVLMYHYIRPITPGMTTSSRWLSVSPKHFHAQMEELVRFGYHTITPDDLADAVAGLKTLPAKPVLLTFDDGYRDQYTEAFPILKANNLRATFFVMSDYDTNPLYLSKDLIRALDRSGLITIAAHTRHHVGLADLKTEKQKDEIFGSKQILERIVSHPVTAFAYPYGNFNTKVKQLVHEAGYRSAFSTILGSMHTTSSLFEARRIRVLDDEHLEPILRKFSKQ